MKISDMKVYIEDEKTAWNRIKKDLRDIETGKADTLKEESFSFESLDKLRSYLTPKRVELLRTIRKNNPSSIYELAKMVGRTPENVNTDIKFLKSTGFVETRKTKTKRKRVIPTVDYDKIIFELRI